MNSGLEREAARQQRLLQALWGAAADPHGPTLRDGSTAGLQTYRANAAGHAERALAAMHPTVAALVGAEAFAALARALWRQHPPERGDLGEWGNALPGCIAAQASLAPEPYLADSARLDALVHQASRARDAAADGSQIATALGQLAQHPPQDLRLRLRPGCSLLRSAWPVVGIWQAHQQSALHAADRFDAVRAALAAGQEESAFVWRDGWQVCVEALDSAAAAFTTAVLGHDDLATALDAAGPAFSFERWLHRAVPGGWLVDVMQIRAR